MQQPTTFPSKHSWDRNFFLLMTLLAWFAIVSGFINDILKLKAEGRLHFPIIVHIHAVVFVGWLLLFTTQVWLIRKDNFALHKKLGIAGIILAVLVVVLGVLAALITENIKYGTKYSDPAFTSVMLGDMLVFAGVATAGIRMRKSPSAHKRLMLLSILFFTDAGFGRWLSFYIAPLFGDKLYWTCSGFSEGFIPYIGFQMLPPFMLVFAVGLYDLITRKRLHRVYVFAVLWALCIDLIAGWLYFSPEWLKIATRLIGH